MASQLDISQNAYCKIENEQVKIKVETLLKIAKILEINISDLFKDEWSVKKETQYESERRLYEQIIQSKDQEIDTLKKLLQVREIART